MSLKDYHFYRNSWKCGKKGHLPSHCTKTCLFKTPTVNLLGEKLVRPEDTQPEVYTDKKGNTTIYSPALRKTFNRYAFPKLITTIRCKQILKDSHKKSCSICGSKNRLVVCLDCNLAFCDNGIHLSAHLKDTSHNSLLSFKLSRQVMLN